MPKRDRPETGIEVHVLDLGPLFEAHTEWYNEEIAGTEDEEGNVREEALRLYTSERIGVVFTEDGPYVLSDEGVGKGSPVTEDDPYEFYLHKEMETDSENHRASSAFPVAEASLTLEMIEELDDDESELSVDHTEPLEEFIRQFGSRLENNFDDWHEELSGKVPA